MIIAGIHNSSQMEDEIGVASSPNLCFESNKNEDEALDWSFFDFSLTFVGLSVRTRFSRGLCCREIGQGFGLLPAMFHGENQKGRNRQVGEIVRK
jgi:hypothetical protein